MITKRKIDKIFKQFEDSFTCNKIITGGYEYIFIYNETTNVFIFDDKTKLEALTNHIHLIEPDICLCRKYLCSKVDYLGLFILSYLTKRFPQNKFVVYTEISNKNSVTIRFRQQWNNEEYYYDIYNLNYKDTIIKYYKN